MLNGSPTTTALVHDSSSTKFSCSNSKYVNNLQVKLIAAISQLIDSNDKTVPT